jgi:hypothetical protein
VVTVTSTTPDAGPGVTAVISVSETTTNDEAAIPPNSTAVAPVNDVPVIVTFDPPLRTPASGDTLDTAGLGVNVRMRLGTAVESTEVDTAVADNSTNDEPPPPPLPLYG